MGWGGWGTRLGQAWVAVARVSLGFYYCHVGGSAQVKPTARRSPFCRQAGIFLGHSHQPSLLFFFTNTHTRARAHTHTLSLTHTHNVLTTTGPIATIISAKLTTSSCCDYEQDTTFVFFKRCRTSTETIKPIRGRGAQDGHLDFHTAPELWGHNATNAHLFNNTKTGATVRCPPDGQRKPCFITLPIQCTLPHVKTCTMTRQDVHHQASRCAPRQVKTCTTTRRDVHYDR